jgi:two-component system, NarL family, nitrate/nitrite response regulator NarL
MRPTRAELDALSDALAGLADERVSAAPWRALPALCALAATGGEWVIDTRAARKLGAPLVLRARRAPPAGLSARERQVAALVLRGKSNKEIARVLKIGLGTVKDHVHRVLGKTGNRSRAEFIADA